MSDGLRQAYLLSLLLCLLGQQHGLDVGQDAALRDGHSRQQLVQLFVVPDGQLQVPRDDAGLLVVPSGVSGQLEHLRGQILHDGRQIDRTTGTDPFGVVALPQQTVDPTNRELQPGTARAGLGRSLDFASLATAGHDLLWLVGGVVSRNLLDLNKERCE